MVLLYRRSSREAPGCLPSRSLCGARSPQTLSQMDKALPPPCPVTGPQMCHVVVAIRDDEVRSVLSILSLASYLFEAGNVFLPEPMLSLFVSLGP